MKILFIKAAQGSVETVGQRLEEAVKAHKFGIIAVIDLKTKMAERGVEFGNACRIYEVCNPMQAKKVLERDMRISTALPCRIAVYQDNGEVKVATLLPTELLSLFAVPELSPVAQDVENTIKAIISDTVAA